MPICVLKRGDLCVFTWKLGQILASKRGKICATDKQNGRQPVFRMHLHRQPNANTKGTFFWDYSGIGILGIDDICVLLGAIPFSEWTEYHSVHSALESRMNRMEGMRFTRNIQNTLSFGKFLAGNPTRPLSPVAPGRHGSSQVTSAMGIPFPDLGAFFSKLKFRVFCYS